MKRLFCFTIENKDGHYMVYVVTDKEEIPAMTAVNYLSSYYAVQFRLCRSPPEVIRIGATMIPCFKRTKFRVRALHPGTFHDMFADELHFTESMQ